MDEYIGMKWPIYEFKPIQPCKNTKINAIKPIPLQTLFHVTIKSMTGKYTTVYIHDKMTIKEVKDELEKIDKIPPHHQRLVFNGKELHDDCLVESYHLQKSDIIHIILRLRGGMFHETSSRIDHETLEQATLLEIEKLERNIHFKRELFEVLRLSKQVSSNLKTELQLLVLKPQDCLPLP